MCGLFGVATNRNGGLTYKQTDFLEQAAYVDALRGWDSTGFAVLDKDMNGVGVYKRALPAADFLLSRVGLRAMKEAKKTSVRAVIGHNRAATVGSVNDDYAHPFQYGHIIGAHNGTLKSRRGLVNNNSPVDSMDLIHAFSACDPEDYVKFLRKVDGAYALTIANAKTGLLYFVRNNGRPLNLIWDDSDLYWGSEVGMLWWLLERNKIDINGKSIEHLEVEPHRLYSYDPSSGELEYVDYIPEPVTSHVSKPAARLTGPSNAGSVYAREELINVDQLISSKILHKSDLDGTALAVDLQWRPYNQSGNNIKNSWGELTGKWYVDAKSYVKLSIDGVPQEVADTIIKEDGGIAMFTPTHGYRDVNTKELLRICSRLRSISRCTDATDGDTDKEEEVQTDSKKSNVTPIRKHRLERGDIDTFTQEELDTALDKGCSGCKRNMDYGDLSTLGIYNGKIFCGECSDQYEESLANEEVSDAVH